MEGREEVENVDDDGAFHTSSQLPPLHPRTHNKNRRRGKGKGKGLLTNPAGNKPQPPPPARPTMIMPTLKRPIPLSFSTWTTAVPQPKKIESDIWEDEAFKSYVDAADPKAMELLIRDLALALPGISEQIVERKQSDLSTTTFMQTTTSNSPELRSNNNTWASAELQKAWANRERTTSLDMLSTAVARAVVDDAHPVQFEPLIPPPIAKAITPEPVWMEYDPDRQVRVAWVVEMAENERLRRQEEREQITWKDRLQFATRIEWAVLASEAFQQKKSDQDRAALLAKVLLEEETERARRINTTLPDDVSVGMTDYEVICPYNSLGCEATLLRSELPAHFNVCVYRAEVREANRLAVYYETYNPLDHIIVCPYTVVGCTHSCRRADLPAHLACCPLRVEAMSNPPHSSEYEVVCPYSTKGCRHTCDLALIPKHLAMCTFGPSSRADEEAERRTNKAFAIDAEEEERQRRIADCSYATSPRGRRESKDLQRVLTAITTTTKSSWTKERNRKVQWVKQAAEIEKMRRAEELLAIESTCSSNSSNMGHYNTVDDSPPGRRQIVLEMALRRQKLHHANWFPKESLAFEGRRTHVAQFHNHLETQTRVLHRVLHDEIERFGRDCALWEIEAKDAVNEMIDNIRIVIESCWQKYVSTSMPTLHIFGSFASELSVPGVSDLDLVVVPGEEMRAAKWPTNESEIKQLMKDRLEAARRCSIIGEALSNCPDILQNVRVIDTASVPLVTMSTNTNAFQLQPGRGLDIDLTVALSQHDGVQAAEFVKLLRVRFPPLMPMVRLLKGTFFSFSGFLLSLTLLFSIFIRSRLGESISRWVVLLRIGAHGRR